MVEKMVLDYLNEVIPVTAYMERPEKAGEEYVLIEKTSSGEENFITSAVLAIQSISQSLYKAAELNEKVKKAMKEIISLDDVSKVTLNGDYNFTDATKKEYRYQAVFELVHY